MRFFFIAVAETKYWETIISVVKAWDEVLRKTRGVRVGVLIRFSKWKSVGCIPCKICEKYDVPLFVDNGAFDYLSRSDLERNQLSETVLHSWIGEYANWLARWYNYVTAAAMPDVPVHGRDFLPTDIRLQRIILTNRLHLKFARMLRRMEPAALNKCIIVIQGFEVPEYQLSACLNITPELSETQTMSNRGPYTGVVGVGSVCVRKPSAKGKTSVLASGRAAGTLKQFMREFLSARWPKEVRAFHFFGLHTEAVREFGSHPRYWASDTGAHGLNYKWKWRTRLGCDRPNSPKCYELALESQLRTTLGNLLSQPLDVNSSESVQATGSIANSFTSGGVYGTGYRQLTLWEALDRLNRRRLEELTAEMKKARS